MTLARLAARWLASLDLDQLYKLFGFGRPSKITCSTQSKVKRQAFELSDVTKQKAKGKVRPVLATPIMSIRGILMTLVLKVPSAYIIQSGQK